MIKEYFEIINSSGDLIKGDLRIPLNSTKVPVIVFSHGFKGFRNWSFIPFVCEKFTENGYLSINYDSSLNGIIDDVNQVYDDSVFRRNKISVEISDFTLLLNSINVGNFPNKEFYNLWNGEIYLVGHSLGGALSILTAVNFENVKKISLWASISKLDRNTERQKEFWKVQGFSDIEIKPTGQKLHLDYSYIEDREKNIGPNAVLNAMMNLNIPVQIIHSESDKTVSIKEAHELEGTESNIRKRELYVIKRAGHTFNCVHPFRKFPEALNEAVNSTLDFFFVSSDD